MASEVDDANRCQGSALAGVSLFEGLSPQELDAIARRGVLRTLRSNTAFIQKGEEASSLYLILSGRVRVYADRREGEHRVLDVLGPGAHLGELARWGDSVRTASAITLEDSTFLVLSRRAFLECLAENPQLALNLDATRFIQTLESHVGSGAAQRYRAWSTFRRNGLPLILRIGGCTGTG